MAELTRVQRGAIPCKRNGIFVEQRALSTLLDTDTRQAGLKMTTEATIDILILRGGGIAALPARLSSVVAPDLLFHFDVVVVILFSISIIDFLLRS